jgi:hypothetical protein
MVWASETSFFFGDALLFIAVFLTYFKYKTKHDSYVKLGFLSFSFHSILIINKSPGFCLRSIKALRYFTWGDYQPTRTTRNLGDDGILRRLASASQLVRQERPDHGMNISSRNRADCFTKRRRRKVRLMKHCSLPCEYRLSE